MNGPLATRIILLACSLSYGSLAVAASGSGWSAPCNDGKVLRFGTDFGADVELTSVRDGQNLVFQGGGAKSACPRTVGQTLSEPEARFGTIEIQFQGGQENERQARLVPSPTDPSRRVLEFELNRPNVRNEGRQPPKGRIQMNVYGNEGIRQLQVSTRMYLGSDFNLVRSYPGAIDWLTVSEWWNNAGWKGGRFPFRITVNLVKESGGSAPLQFKVHAQTLDMARQRWSNTVWEETARHFVVPVGRWVNLEYGFEEGDAGTGRFTLAATVDGGKRVTVFDIRNYTHHPDDPSPDGLGDFNPVKLYTSGDLVDYIRAQGGALRIYWDELAMNACSPPNPYGLEGCAGAVKK